MDCSEQVNNRFQILVFGVSGVGKTTLIKQLREVSAHVFGQEVHQGRDGSDDNSSSEKLIFQEIAQFQYPSFKKLAIQRSDAFILMYDADDHVSFDYVSSFFAEIKHVKGENAPIFVVGNRTNISGVCDGQYDIDNCDINENLDSSHIQLCALTGDGMKDLFSCMLGRLYQHFTFPTENVNIKKKQPLSKRLSDYFRRKIQKLNSN